MEADFHSNDFDYRKQYLLVGCLIVENRVRLGYITGFRMIDLDNLRVFSIIWKLAIHYSYTIQNNFHFHRRG